MSIFRKEGGIMDAIRCDEKNYLIWKWRPNGAVTKTKKENAIRWGSVLTVRAGSLAVFVYKGSHDYIMGPFSEKLSTGNLPIIAPLISLAYGGGSPFPAEVYFINLAELVQLNFAVPYFDVYDPAYTEFAVPVAVRGTISFHIGDYMRFIELHRLDEFDLDTFSVQIKNAVSKYVKGIVANAPEDLGVPVVQLERKITEIDRLIGEDIKTRLERDHAVTVTGIDIGAIDIDTTSDGYRSLMQVTKDITSATLKARSQADIQNIHDMQRINAENYSEELRIKRDEGRYAQHLDTQTQHINAHTINRQAEVGIAASEGLGSRTSASSVGFDPVGMSAGMEIGSAFGRNVADMIDGVMDRSSPQTPPPIPNMVYYVVQNGKQTGPFDIAVLRSMAECGTLTAQTLVWCAGMPNWAPAGSMAELAELF